jgi:hypothetical protein
VNLQFKTAEKWPSWSTEIKKVKMNRKTQTTNPTPLNRNTKPLNIIRKALNINRKALKLNSIEMGVKATRNEF